MEIYLVIYCGKVSTAKMEDEFQELPDPKDLYEAALGEVENHRLLPYIDTIMALRLNGHSWRSVAEWLTKSGLKVSHTAARTFYQDAMNSHLKEELERREVEIMADISSKNPLHPKVFTESND